MVDYGSNSGVALHSIAAIASDCSTFDYSARNDEKGSIHPSTA